MARTPRSGRGAREDNRPGSPPSDPPKRRRSMEPVAAWRSCKWLPRCFGADAVHELWTELGMWAVPLTGALHLPQFGRRFPCPGCPIFRTREDDAA